MAYTEFQVRFIDMCKSVLTATLLCRKALSQYHSELHAALETSAYRIRPSVCGQKRSVVRVAPE